MADAPDATPPSDPPDASDAPPSSEPPSSSDPSPDSGEELDSAEFEADDDEPVPESKAPPGPPPKKPAKPTPGGRELPPPKSERPPPADYQKPASQLPPRKFPPDTVADIMTRKVFVVHEEDSLTNIEETMQRFRFRHLPVVDEERKILGVLSHRDILRASASTLSEMTEARNEFIHKHAKVAAIMNRDVVTVPIDESVREVGKRMRRKGIGCVLVEDEDETLLGIVTEADYVNLAVALLKPEPEDE